MTQDSMRLGLVWDDWSLLNQDTIHATHSMTFRAARGPRSMRRPSWMHRPLEAGCMYNLNHTLEGVTPCQLKTVSGLRARRHQSLGLALNPHSTTRTARPTTIPSPTFLALRLFCRQTTSPRSMNFSKKRWKTKRILSSTCHK